MWHRALSSIPSRPVLVIAPVLVTCVLAYYFWNLKGQCTAQAELRETFTQRVATVAASGGDLVLAQETRFPWDHVKGFEGFRPKQKNRSCPFGWDWSTAERAQIIEDGLLSMLIFFHDRNITAYIEFRNDEVSIEEFEQALTPETARFTVSRGSSSGSKYRLDIAR